MVFLPRRISMLVSCKFYSEKNRTWSQQLIENLHFLQTPMIILINFCNICVRFNRMGRVWIRSSTLDGEPIGSTKVSGIHRKTKLFPLWGKRVDVELSHSKNHPKRRTKISLFILLFYASATNFKKDVALTFSCSMAAQISDFHHQPVSTQVVMKLEQHLMITTLRWFDNALYALY